MNLEILVFLLFAKTYEQTNWKTFFGKLHSKLDKNEKRAMLFYCLDDTLYVFYFKRFIISITLLRF